MTIRILDFSSAASNMIIAIQCKSNPILTLYKSNPIWTLYNSCAKMLGNLSFYFCSYPFVALFNQFIWSNYLNSSHYNANFKFFKWISAIWIFLNGKCLNSYLGYDSISGMCNLHILQFCICSSCNVFSAWFLTWNVCIYTFCTFVSL